MFDPCGLRWPAEGVTVLRDQTQTQIQVNDCIRKYIFIRCWPSTAQNFRVQYTLVELSECAFKECLWMIKASVFAWKLPI
jgi:hypothetical protein